MKPNAYPRLAPRRGHLKSESRIFRVRGGRKSLQGKKRRKTGVRFLPGGDSPQPKRKGSLSGSVSSYKREITTVSRIVIENILREGVEKKHQHDVYRGNERTLGTAKYTSVLTTAFMVL